MKWDYSYSGVYGDLVYVGVYSLLFLGGAVALQNWSGADHLLFLAWELGEVAEEEDGGAEADEEDEVDRGVKEMQMSPTWEKSWHFSPRSK